MRLYGDVAAELDVMREKMSTGLTMLAAMKVKHVRACSTSW